jgi:serine protease
MGRLGITLSLFAMLTVAAPAIAAPAGSGYAAARERSRPAAAPTGSRTVFTTGNVLVLLDRGRAAAAAGRWEVRAVTARVGGSPAGRSVPEIGLVTVRPPTGVSPAGFARTLRGLPGVDSVSLEHRYVPRLMPNDPALHAPDPFSGVLQWTLQAEHFPAAWNLSRGDGTLVGLVDTGVDATHPDLRSKIAVAVDQQQSSSARGTVYTDEVGHGTHVASLACAATNNGIGLAGAGYNCKLVVEKSDFSDSSIASAIVDATQRRVQAINLSFGPSQPEANSASPAEVRALSYAAARHVVLVAAAADNAGSEQGDPANVLQPAGTGPDLSAGLGLDVTAADSSGHRAGFAGYGSEISLAAFGALSPGAGGLAGIVAPPGIFGAFPAGPTDVEAPPSPCGCRTIFAGSTSYAYLQGTSMAAPQVTAAAALMRGMNPYATVADIITTLKRTATRPAGTGWTSDLGWGILNAGAALEASRRIDRLSPVSHVLAPRVARRRSFVLRWVGHDQRRPELIASGISVYEVYVRAGHRRPRRLARTFRHTLVIRGRPRGRYVFFTVAVDRAGNRESHPVDAVTRVARTAR